ncbi:hypothetical protein [Paenibacillus agricola]|nr:hypothetical protein [Paenibacillus agricola]
MLFWKRTEYCSSDIAIIEADSDELANAIALQSANNFAKISGRKYRIAHIKSLLKMRVGREDYQTNTFM